MGFKLIKCISLLFPMFTWAQHKLSSVTERLFFPAEFSVIQYFIVRPSKSGNRYYCLSRFNDIFKWYFQSHTVEKLLRTFHLKTTLFLKNSSELKPDVTRRKEESEKNILQDLLNHKWVRTFSLPIINDLNTGTCTHRAQEVLEPLSFFCLPHIKKSFFCVWFFFYE